MHLQPVTHFAKKEVMNEAREAISNEQTEKLKKMKLTKEKT